MLTRRRSCRVPDIKRLIDAACTAQHMCLLHGHWLQKTVFGFFFFALEIVWSFDSWLLCDLSLRNTIHIVVIPPFLFVYLFCSICPTSVNQFAHPQIAICAQVNWVSWKHFSLRFSFSRFLVSVSCCTRQNATFEIRIHFWHEFWETTQCGDVIFIFWIVFIYWFIATK